MPTRRTTKAQEPAKPATKAKVATKAPEAPQRLSEPTYNIPREVAEWIERAQSIINHQRGEVERLRKENNELKSWRRWAEQRILRSEHES